MGGCGCNDCSSDSPSVQCGKKVMDWALMSTEGRTTDRFWQTALIADMFERSAPLQAIPVDPMVDEFVAGTVSSVARNTNNLPPISTWQSPGGAELTPALSVLGGIPLWPFWRLPFFRPPLYPFGDPTGGGGGPGFPNPRQDPKGRGAMPTTYDGYLQCCVKSFEYYKSIKDTSLPPELIRFTFEAEAEFEEKDGCLCSCCRFEQRVHAKVRITTHDGGKETDHPYDQPEELGTPEQKVEDCAAWHTISSGLLDTAPGKPGPIEWVPNTPRNIASLNYDKIPYWLWCYGDRGDKTDPKFQEPVVEPGKDFPGYYKTPKQAGDSNKTRESTSEIGSSGGACYFWMTDSPSFKLRKSQSGIGVWNFTGLIHDRCNQDVVVAEKSFTVVMWGVYLDQHNDHFILKIKE